MMTSQKYMLYLTLRYLWEYINYKFKCSKMMNTKHIAPQHGLLKC